MKLFISWSGDTSRELAKILRSWLQTALQGVQPFVSEEDIAKGAQWTEVMFRELDESKFGILCVTKENHSEEWVNFEAGALSKSFGRSRVSPLLFDVDKNDIKNPLALFQATDLEPKDMFRLYAGLNESCAQPLQDDVLRRTFDMWWPQLDEQVKQLRSAAASSAPEPVTRSNDDVLDEILTLVRQQQRTVADQLSKLGATAGSTGLVKSWMSLRADLEDIVANREPDPMLDELMLQVHNFHLRLMRAVEM